MYATCTRVEGESAESTRAVTLRDARTRDDVRNDMF